MVETTLDDIEKAMVTSMRKNWKRFCLKCKTVIKGVYGETKCSNCGASFPSGMSDFLKEVLIK